MTSARPEKFPYWAYLLALAVILLFALAPVISVFVAGLIAESNGCPLDEGSVNSCIVGGMELGPLLYMLFVLGWFMLATLPLGGGALLVWLASFLIHRIGWGQMQKVKRS